MFCRWTLVPAGLKLRINLYCNHHYRRNCHCQPVPGRNAVTYERSLPCSGSRFVFHRKCHHRDHSEANGRSQSRSRSPIGTSPAGRPYPKESPSPAMRSLPGPARRAGPTGVAAPTKRVRPPPDRQRQSREFEQLDDRLHRQDQPVWPNRRRQFGRSRTSEAGPLPYCASPALHERHWRLERPRLP